MIGNYRVKTFSMQLLFRSRHLVAFMSIVPDQGDQLGRIFADWAIVLTK
jgi:hypothetical protein